jgi:PAS domain S-box-containing protein
MRATEDSDLSSHSVEQDLQLLIRASDLLSESLDYQTTLQNIARLAVPEFADWCAVDLVLDGDVLHRVAIEHVDPEMVRWALEILEKHPPSKDAQGGIWSVLKTGEPVLVPHVPENFIEEAARDQEHLELLKKINIRSLLIVPLKSRGEIIGGLTLVSSQPGRYGQRELDLFDLVAKRAGTAVDNARLFSAAQEELEARRKTEIELRASEQRFRAMADRAPVMIWISGLDKQCIWLNEPWLAFTGRKMEQELGNGWIEGIHPEDLQRCLDVRTGSFDRREVFQMHYRLRRNDGAYRWVLDHGTPLDGGDGNFAGYIGSCIDVHEQVELQNELEKRVDERTSQLAEAYSRLERFSYSVSHDLRSPLRAISMASSILMSEYGDKLDEAGKQELRRATAASRRMSQMIDDLLEHAQMRTKEIQRHLVDVGELTRSVLTEISGYELDKFNIIAPKGLIVVADSVLLRIALQNLIENALKFSKTKDTPQIEVGMASGTEQIVYVRDNGIGLDPTEAAEIFEAFSRGSNARDLSGTGIGLANVKQVIEKHGGKVWVESEPGQGATFYFTLQSSESNSRSTVAQNVNTF